MKKPRLFRAGSVALLVVAVVSVMAPPMTVEAQEPLQVAGIQYTSMPGFTIERVTPADAPQSYIAMTFDDKGQIVGSRRNGPLVMFVDTTGDGIFDTEKIVSDQVEGCMGMWYDGPTLWAVCSDVVEDQAGVYVMRDTDGDDVMNTFERFTVLRGRTGQHGPHAMRRGPDGLPTMISGNNSGPPFDLREPDSPYRQPEEWQFLPRFTDARGHCSDCMAPGATISRVNRESGTYTVLTAGMRNPYDHAYNLAGEMFTFDADMEWDLGMPWYRPIRTVHAIPGGEMGWRNGSGKWPPYYLDSLPAVRDVFRGSPVGVEFYQHNVYPKEFHDAFFEADYSRGRLLWTPMVRKGATYEALMERAEIAHGEPLPITDLEVGPDGMIYFTTLGSEGGLYRIRYDWAEEQAEPEGVLAIVRQPQPLSSWGWAALEAKKAEMAPRGRPSWKVWRAKWTPPPRTGQWRC